MDKNKKSKRKRSRSPSDAEDGQMEKKFSQMSTDELEARVQLIDNEISQMNRQINMLQLEKHELAIGLRRNQFIKNLFCQPPFLVGTVNELWDYDEVTEDTMTSIVEEEEEIPDETQCSVVKFLGRKMSYFPNTGLVDPDKLTPGQEVCLHPWSNVIIDTLPKSYDLRVQALEVVERPVDKFSDIGGLDREIMELIEAVELPIRQKATFEKLGITAPKGVLLYGPPGTGKTLIARACAAETQCVFLRLNATLLNQTFIGDGAKIVRESFDLAKSKSPSIIFIDEIDAIGAKRNGNEKNTDREVHSTMMEILNQMDGFSTNDGVKVIAATNRIDILDPALLRSGRFDKKIEIPEPNEQARISILYIHGAKMKFDETVNLEEVAKMTEGFNAVMCRAVCAEAGMNSIRRNAKLITQEDFYEAVVEVSNKRTVNVSDGYV